MPSENNTYDIKKSLSNRVTKRFTDNINSLNNSMDILAPNICLAAESIVATLLNEKKVLICGCDSSHILSEYMASQLINRFETDRPALPAIALSETNAFSSNNQNTLLEAIYSRQIQVLGQEKDILIIFISNELTTSIVDAIQTAHEQKITIILICADTSEDITSILENNDQIIQLSLNKQSQVLELQLLILHCICDLIDHLLFGTP